MFKSIVVGCDGSPEGRDAVALGATIASATGSLLWLVGVFPWSFVPVPLMDRKVLCEQTTRSLRRDRDLLAPNALTHAVADTSVPRALRHQAERWHADLVIVGSNPSAPTGHVAISRRGRQLLYDAPFSLAIAARGFHERSMEVSSIGVGYEDGPEAQEALAVAGGLAHVTNATLRVHRVVEELVPPLTIERVDRELWEPQRRTALAAAEAAASHFGVPTDVSASIGDPGYELRALSEDVDLLVVGSRRWGPVARLVSGGVGETLVADASCSILIVPRPPARRGRDAGQPREHRAVVA